MTSGQIPQDSKEESTATSTNDPSTNVVRMPQSWISNLRIPISATRQPPLNANQMTSLSAMIAYISHKSGQSEYAIEHRLADHFRVANAKLLSAGDFDEAIRYLADILPL